MQPNIIIIMIFYCGLVVHITDTRAQKVVSYTSAHITETVFAHDQHWEEQNSLSSPEMITIRFAGWISGRIVSLQPDKDIQKLLSNGNRIRIRISETLLSIFRGFRLLEKVTQSTIMHLLSSEASFQPSAP